MECTNKIHQSVQPEKAAVTERVKEREDDADPTAAGPTASPESTKPAKLNRLLRDRFSVRLHGPGLPATRAMVELRRKTLRAPDAPCLRDGTMANIANPGSVSGSNHSGNLGSRLKRFVMRRREFLVRSAAGGGALAGGAAGAAAGDVTAGGEVVVERAMPGKPHAGKVLATIAPHSDDHSILAGGTIAKLIAEGYTGYLIRTSNDEKDSFDLSVGQTIAANESDNQKMAGVLGIKQGL